MTSVVASRARWLVPRWRRLATGLSLAFCVASPLVAQRADSARAGVAPPASPRRAQAEPLEHLRDSISHVPPVSPGRAFLQSLLVPGWGQASLRRPTAGTIFTAIEAMSITMLIQSKHELSEARRAARDSVVDHYEPPSTPDGTPTPVYAPNQFAGRIGARKQAIEDWAALLIFNHLLSGADAFIAAHLWNVPVEVSPGSSGQGAMLSVHIPW